MPQHGPKSLAIGLAAFDCTLEQPSRLVEGLELGLKLELCPLNGFNFSMSQIQLSEV